MGSAPQNNFAGRRKTGGRWGGTRELNGKAKSAKNRDRRKHWAPGDRDAKEEDAGRPAWESGDNYPIALEAIQPCPEQRKRKSPSLPTPQLLFDHASKSLMTQAWDRPLQVLKNLTISWEQHSDVLGMHVGWMWCWSPSKAQENESEFKQNSSAFFFFFWQNSLKVNVCVCVCTWMSVYVYT